MLGYYDKGLFGRKGWVRKFSEHAILKKKKPWRLLIPIKMNN